jgi:hypothetical protein
VFGAAGPGGFPAGRPVAAAGRGGTATFGNVALGTAGAYALGAGGGRLARRAAAGFTVVQPPAFVSRGSARFLVGQAGAFTITTTGFPAAALSAGGGPLPRGISFVDNHNGTATLSGRPAAGTYLFALLATDAFGRQAAQTFTLSVVQPPAITSAAGVTFRAGQPNTFTITTAGFAAGKIVARGALPAGVALVDKGNGTAILSGKPVARGSFRFTIVLSEGGLPVSLQVFDLIVG